MEFIVLVHEYAHELLHRADDRPASRDTRELEAEAVAFVVGEAVGLNTSDAVTRLHPSVPRRPRGARGFVGPHPARGVSHSEGRQRRRITISLAAPGRRVDGALAGRTSHHRSVSDCRSSTSRARCSRSFPQRSDQFNAMPGHVVQVVCCLRFLRTGCASVAMRPASVRHSRASGRACCHARAKAPPLRRRAPSSCPYARPVMVGSSSFAKEPHITVPRRTKWLRQQRPPRTSPSPTRYWSSSPWTRARDEHLQDQQSIRDEAESWLASLDATVHGVNIRKAD